MQKYKVNTFVRNSAKNLLFGIDLVLFSVSGRLKVEKKSAQFKINQGIFFGLKQGF